MHGRDATLNNRLIDSVDFNLFIHCKCSNCQTYARVLHVSICVLLLQKNQFCEVPRGVGAGHWVACSNKLSFAVSNPHPLRPANGGFLSWTSRSSGQNISLDTSGHPNNHSGARNSRKRCYGIMIWSRVNILHLQNPFFHHRILTFVTVNLSKNVYPVVISCHPAPPVPHQPGRPPTLKSVSNAKPRKRIPTTNGTSAAMGMIKIYCGWKKSPPIQDGSNMFKPYKSWDIWDQRLFSTGGLRNRLQFACMNLLRSCCGYIVGQVSIDFALS